MLSTLISAEEVTLWQFGSIGRLLPGAITLPLVPQGTAPDRSDTTFLYQVVNPTAVALQESGIIVTKPTVTTVSRTIIAAASGWVEPFPLHTIRCSFLTSDVGECLDELKSTTTVGNSGSPRALVIPISSVIPPPRPTPHPAPAPSPLAEPAPSPPSCLKTAPIVCGVLGALALLSLLTLFFVCLRRRRRLHRRGFLQAPASRLTGDVLLPSTPLPAHPSYAFWAGGAAHGYAPSETRQESSASASYEPWLTPERLAEEKSAPSRPLTGSSWSSASSNSDLRSQSYDAQSTVYDRTSEQLRIMTLQART
ncbi:hypothetical protein MKEN_00480400 [Mycena kentingensis (nom. inval.)]|nr:hypothetical protein MKEN_00480400 [Mycena kentingensis (nom. inval.)]